MKKKSKESSKFRNYILSKIAQVRSAKDLDIIARFCIRTMMKKVGTDKYTKDYYKSYFGDYGQELARDVEQIVPKSKEWAKAKKKKSPGWEADTGYKEMEEGPRRAATIHKLSKDVGANFNESSALVDLAIEYEG